MAQPEPHLSVIIPAFNEESRLPLVLQDVCAYLRRQAYPSEVLVVDDGSRDRTVEGARRVDTQGVEVRLLAHPDGRNHGKGASVRLGLLSARGRYRLFMDADNSTRIQQVETFWPRLEAGCGVVLGSRAAAGAKITRRQPWLRVIAGRMGNRWIQALAVPGISDTQAGFKALKATTVLDVVPRLTVDRWGFDVELLAVAIHRGHRICEVPIEWAADPNSKVTYRTYLEVLAEVWHVRKGIRRGLYG